MPEFKYRARARGSSKVERGNVTARDKIEAIKKLRAKQMLILSIDTARVAGWRIPGLHHVGNKDRILFARQFAIMMRAGLPILDALRAIEDETTNQVFKKTILSLARDIEGGTSLSEAFARYPDTFPPIFLSVAKVGEKSGKLEEVLEKLATQLENDDELVSKIRGAMIYPIFVLTALIGVIIIILVFIIPQLRGLFEDAGIKLPLVTRILLATSGFMRRYFILLAALIIGSLIGIRLGGRYFPIVRHRLEQIRIRIPVFGKLYKQMIIARFTHTLATLLSAGLPMIEAIRTTADVLNSPIYKDVLDSAINQIESGQTLSHELLAHKEFPTMIGHMIVIGEKSGKIDEMLQVVAGFFDKEVEALTRNLSALLEPLLMILMGLGVGVVVASVIVPIYSLVNAV